MVLFLLALILQALLPFCTQFNIFSWLYHKIRISEPLQLIFTSFFIGTYIDLLIGCLVNTENDYLFEVPSNWGIGGNLNFSDQFSVILGNIFFVLCVAFPFFTFYILHRRQKGHFMDKHHLSSFDKKYHALYSDTRRDLHGLLQFSSVFLIKRTLFVLSAWYLGHEVFTLLQVAIAVKSSLCYCCYVLHFRPYLDPYLNKLELLNELCLLVLCYHMILFTDVVPAASTKVQIGWSFVCISITNFLFPNLMLIITSQWKEVKRWL